MTALPAETALSAATVLPADLAEPLHILEPTSLPWEWLLLPLSLWLLVRWWKRRAKKPRIATKVAPAKAQDIAPLAKSLNDIRQQTMAIGDYRQGCHDLATTLRQHQEETTGKPYTRWTAPEMLAQGEQNISTFFDLLAGLRFRQQPPDRSDFESVVDLARDTFLKGKKRNTVLKGKKR